MLVVMKYFEMQMHHYAIKHLIRKQVRLGHTQVLKLQKATEAKLISTRTDAKSENAFETKPKLSLKPTYVYRPCTYRHANIHRAHSLTGCHLKTKIIHICIGSN